MNNKKLVNDPTIKFNGPFSGMFFWMSLHDLGLLILLLSPGMILSILLLLTFAEGG